MLGSVLKFNCGWSCVKQNHILMDKMMIMSAPRRDGFSTSRISEKNKVPKAFMKNKLTSERVNKFYQDKGLRRELRSLDLDKDDPAFHPDFIGSETDFEELREDTRSFQRENKVKPDREKVKRILIKKNMFPKKKPIDLLTFMEKETIRFLHDKDPNEWTVARLSESFPATHQSIKAVLKTRDRFAVTRFRKADMKVAENWKRLSRGEIEIEPELRDHLKSFNRTSLNLSRSDQEEIAESMKQRLQEDNMPRLLAEPGEFTRIVTDYQDRVEQLNKRKLKDSSQPPESSHQEDAENEMATLLRGTSLESTPPIGASTPYGDTAMFDFGLDYSNDPEMDIEKFREIYLKKLNPVLDPSRNKTNLPFRNQESRETPAMKAYNTWLQQRTDKSSLVSKNIKKVDAEEVLNSLSVKEIRRNEKVDRIQEERQDKEDVVYKDKVRMEVDRDSGSQTVYVISEVGKGQQLNVETSPDFIEIPAHLKHKHNFFQYGDSMYDSEGEFLYRIPGLAPK